MFQYLVKFKYEKIYELDSKQLDKFQYLVKFKYEKI